LCAALALPFAVLLLGQDRAWLSRPEPGWLYVLDSKRNAAESAVLVVDPLKSRIVASLSGGYQPDIAVSPDGSRLYLTYSEKENTPEGKLVIVDTSTGAILKELPNKHRWLTTHYSYDPNMVLSQDGAWLYLFKMLESQDGPTHYIEIFDAKLNIFLPNKVDLPDCISATMIPAASGLYVICGGADDVRFVSIVRGSPVGSVNSVIADVSSVFHDGSRTAVPGQIPGRPEKHFIATGVVNSDGKIFTVLTTDGLFLRGDAASGHTVEHGSLDRASHISSPGSGTTVSSGWLDDRWVRNQSPVLSPDGKRLYLGLGAAKRLYNGDQLFETIAVLDTATMGFIKSLDPHRAFWSFAINATRSRLFVVDPEHAVIGVVDMDSGQELNTISGVGTTPVYAVVAP